MAFPSRYEPIAGYSVPVVRVWRTETAVACTLSFSAEGKPINPPEDCPQSILREAWAAWQAHKPEA